MQPALAWVVFFCSPRFDLDVLALVEASQAVGGASLILGCDCILRRVEAKRRGLAEIARLQGIITALLDRAERSSRPWAS